MAPIKKMRELSIWANKWSLNIFPFGPPRFRNILEQIQFENKTHWKISSSPVEANVLLCYEKLTLRQHSKLLRTLNKMPSVKWLFCVRGGPEFSQSFPGASSIKTVGVLPELNAKYLEEMIRKIQEDFHERK